VQQIKHACAKGCGIGGTAAGDAFVTKINAAGTAIVYSSVIGGKRDDEGHGIAVDNLGNAYLVGFTESLNFPQVDSIPGACLGICGTKFPDNVFVAEVSAAGNGLVYSSLIGGSDSGQGLGIAVDASGNAYLTGFTQSAGACQGTCGQRLQSRHLRDQSGAVA